MTQATGAYVPCQEMPDLITRFNADSRSLTRFYTPASENNFRGGYGGGSDAGGSPEKRTRLNTLYTDYLKKLSEISFDALSQECKVDYLLFKRDLNEKLKLAADEAAEYEKIKKWFPFADQIYALEKTRRRGIQPAAEKVAGDWNTMSIQIKELQTKLADEKGLNIESVYEAGQVIDNLKKSLTSVFQFYNGYDPMFTWWVPKSYQKLDEALTAYAVQFKSKTNSFAAADKSGIIGQPIGQAELMRQLKYEMIPYTPEELIAIANKEFAWCDAEMLKASKEMGFGNDWKAALEKVKQTYVPAGKQPEAILKLYTESIDFLKKNDLITIPPLAEETWGMGMMSPERQLVNPFFTGGTEITISYPTNTMDEHDKLMSMRGNNPHFSRATVHHELIAGHNLQGFMNARNRSYRNFGTPFWTEGWALYWELLLWDMKFPQGPEDRIGMLFWHMHRCARIIFSLNYHTGKWTPQQCIDFLVDRVGHERANAAGEVRRSFEGRYSPLYQVAYLTGGRQFYALKNELVERGKMSYKQYHDAVMGLNAMPVEMIRAVLTNQPLQKDFNTKWRFYDHMDMK
ncbi:DUF885 family protein [Pedobacter sp. AW31-3R]|uniref:DUF885 family protein n=1 Tax=Pedobacter sp. AW31-3R TaxID=3445781 RepID=UPI003F9F5D06